MQVTSGSRNYLPVGSARVSFADPLLFPIECLLGSRIGGWFQDCVRSPGKLVHWCCRIIADHAAGQWPSQSRSSENDI